MIDQFRAGYARLLHAPVNFLAKPGFQMVVTDARNQPEWAAWVQPVWLFSIDQTTVCSVAPQYAVRARSVFADIASLSLLAADALAAAQAVCPEHEWVQCELFYYPHHQPPQIDIGQVEKITAPDSRRARYLLNNFDGGAFVVRNDQGNIVAHAGVKDKGLVQEIAVGVDEEWRRKGLGRLVVAGAIHEILARGCVPTYWPDALDNEASYALARSLGFVKAAEMLFCAYEQPGWRGFLPDNSIEPGG